MYVVNILSLNCIHGVDKDQILKRKACSSWDPDPGPSSLSRTYALTSVTANSRTYALTSVATIVATKWRHWLKRKSWKARMDPGWDPS